MRVAFLGLGQMGSEIARNILKAGHELTVWNRSPDKADALVAAGARRATSPAAAAAEAEIVCSMLADDRAVEAVVFGPDGLLSGGAAPLHVGHSTISVALARRLTEAGGGTYVSAPVFGRPPAAEAAQLNVVAAGPAGAIDRAQPIFDAIGKQTFRLGEEPAHANVLKLCGNFLIMGALEAMAEALTLGAKNGLDKAALFDVLTGTLFGAPVFTNYKAALLEGQVRPAGFTAPLGLKDMALVGEAALAARVPMPVLGVVRDHLLQAIAVEGEDVDWAAVTTMVAANAGL